MHKDEDKVLAPSEKELVSEPIVTAANALFTGIISLVASSNPATTAVGLIAGGISSGALSAWQTNNFQKFEQIVHQEFQRISEEKLEVEYLDSDEFKGLIIQIVEASIRSTSDQKRKALANALLNSVVQPTSQFSNKPAILRVISQMTDEEISVLKVLHDYEPSEESPTPFMATVLIVEALNLSEPDVLTSLDGLQQLGLAYDFVQVFAGYESRRTHWSITTLGYRSSQYAMKSASLA